MLKLTTLSLSLSFATLALAACGGGNADTAAPKAPTAETGSTLQRVTPSRNLHLRAAFDADPSVYVGRFVRAGQDGADLDENRASKTVCSKFFTVREVPVNQEMDELVYASSQAAASLGVIGGGAMANASSSSSRGSVLRVRYSIKKKIQVDSDPDQLKACCAKNPGDCSDMVVGEFLMGSGEIYRVAETADDASATVGVPPVAAKASVSDASQWKKVQSFKDSYFAFLPVATGSVDHQAVVAAADEVKRKEDSCDFCRNIPQDEAQKGLYFCGVSSPAAEESSGRAAAMQNARIQVVKHLGEEIATRSTSLSSTAKGLINDQHFAEAIAKGLATRVKDTKYCSEKENSPDHRTVYKVLAYVPNDALAEVASKAVDDAAAAPGAKVKPADAAAAKEAIKKAAGKR